MRACCARRSSVSAPGARTSCARSRAAGATRTPAKAEELCRLHGIELSRSCEELLSRDDVQAVVLATPHSQHCEEIVAAAKAGKHVFVEKPLGLSPGEPALAVSACAESKLTLAVGYNWRFQREGETNMGCTEIMSPWGDAVVEGGPR